MPMFSVFQTCEAGSVKDSGGSLGSQFNVVLAKGEGWIEHTLMVPCASPEQANIPLGLNLMHVGSLWPLYTWREGELGPGALCYSADSVGGRDRIRPSCFPTKSL
jgi:hypothetical protein